MLPLPFHLEAPPREDVPATEEGTDSQTGVLTVPELDDTGTSGSNYRVLLYNDEWHAVDDVVGQLIKATKCSLQKAVQVVQEVELRGRAVCFQGNRAKCHEVTKVLREIRLQCEVDCD